LTKFAENLKTLIDSFEGCVAETGSEPREKQRNDDLTLDVAIHDEVADAVDKALEGVAASLSG
jgi:hypothetical protein